MHNCRYALQENVNSTRKYEDRITYEVVSSASHFEWLAGSIGQENDTDCLIAISLHYGKQQVMKQSRCQEPEYTPTYPYEGFPRKAEVIMTEKERPKYFKPLDIGLRTGDCDYHSPLIITCKLDAIRNHRTRSTNTIKKRSENRREFQDRSQKKRRN